MTERRWAEEHNPFATADPFRNAGDDEGYAPWRGNTKSMVRDLKLCPSPEEGEPVRFIPYMQAITLELSPDGMQLALLCHTSGHVIFMTGRGLADLADLISAKRVQSVHVWHGPRDGPVPDAVVTAIRVERGIAEP